MPARGSVADISGGSSVTASAPPFVLRDSHGSGPARAPTCDPLARFATRQRRPRTPASRSADQKEALEPRKGQAGCRTGASTSGSSTRLCRTAAGTLGPPPERKPMDRDDFVELLNEDLALEYRSIVQYVQHIASVKGAEYLSTLDELGLHVKQELEHALVLARQIDFLGGVPGTDVPAVPTITDSRAALAADLELELAQLERYRERVEQASSLSLPDVAETLAPL